MEELIVEPGKWYGITGSWRYEIDQLQKDVEGDARKIIKGGSGIITGGALNVDYMATQIVLDEGNPREQLKVYLPVPLERYIKHFYHKTHQKVFRQDGKTKIEKAVLKLPTADKLVDQLIRVKEESPESIFDHFGPLDVSLFSYYLRSKKVVEDSDVLLAYHVNKTQGVQDAINMALFLGKPRLIRDYVYVSEESPLELRRTS